jgi:hypothetical protein
MKITCFGEKNIFQKYPDLTGCWQGKGFKSLLRYQGSRTIGIRPTFDLDKMLP